MLGLELKPEDRPHSIKEFLELLDSPIGQNYLDGKREQKNINQLRVNSSPESDIGIRVFSINELAKYKDKANNAIPDLINYLKEKDGIIFGAAESTLSQIGSAAPLLAKVMNDKNESVEIRRRTANIVWRIGAENNAAVPELIEAVGDADPVISWCAIVTIGKIGLEARDAIPALIKKLGAKETEIRAYSAYALGRIGQDAQEAIPDLLKLINGNELDAVILASLEALKAIGYDIKEIKFSRDGKETSGEEYVIFAREEQRNKQKEENKPDIRISWNVFRTMDTPPQIKSEWSEQAIYAGQKLEWVKRG
ncbi:HEAT repeat domain-containing protein [Kamptonema sp. UHCC 0994]|uniref:HEAT repeat domain-containing protein n=1 Tax=Kamptonema sp. UHCC 0994 TaxID=3031329 RepID=UPI0023BAA866|nr:HEAT repeat domain-containing protein [Kamptonema sp. UHCC 0994]MDF0556460.1 HEAT repeat domain-containing protein [Kamptonema sp. UHCC 0994]